jgi:nitrate/nitrite transporter NarK
VRAETGSSSAGPEERSSRVPSWLVVLAAFLGAVVGVIAARLGSFGFAVSFGFAEKTVWNYLDVFLVPVAVAAATAWLTWAQNKRQRKDEDAQEKRASSREPACSR